MEGNKVHLTHCAELSGYKAFNSDLTCRDFQYEIGEEYTMEDDINMCSSGFHFCNDIKMTAQFYSFDPRTRYAEVKATDTIVASDLYRKFATDHIKIVREIPWEEVAGMIDVTDQDRFVLIHWLDDDAVQYRLVTSYFGVLLRCGHEKVSEQLGKIHFDNTNVDIYIGLKGNMPISCPKEFAWEFIKEHTEGE